MRLRSSLLAEQLRHPAAWVAYLTDLAASLAQLAQVKSQQHLPSDTPAAHSLNLPFIMEEVEAGLRRLKNGISGALLGYTSEPLRYGKHRSEEVPVPEHLLALCINAPFSTAFSTGTISNAWRTSLVTPTDKWGDATDPSNYRPIAVGEPLYRLCTIILSQRLVSHIEQGSLRSPSQAAFTPKLGTIHQAFALQHIVEKQKHSNQPVYLCSVDLKAPYDKAQRHLIWQILGQLGVCGNMLASINYLYVECLESICVAGTFGDSVTS